MTRWQCVKKEGITRNGTSLINKKAGLDPDYNVNFTLKLFNAWLTPYLLAYSIFVGLLTNWFLAPKSDTRVTSRMRLYVFRSDSRNYSLRIFFLLNSLRESNCSTQELEYFIHLLTY